MAKSLVGNEYKVVNKIDGYEFRVPKKWEGLKNPLYQDVTNDDSVNYRSILKKGLMDDIQSETGLYFDPANGFSQFIEIRKLALTTDSEIAVNTKEIVEALENLVRTNEAQAGISVTFQTNDLAVNDIKVTKLLWESTTRYGTPMVPFEVFYFFNAKPSNIYIFFYGGANDDETIKELISGGKW